MSTVISDRFLFLIAIGGIAFGLECLVDMKFRHFECFYTEFVEYLSCSRSPLAKESVPCLIKPVTVPSATANLVSTPSCGTANISVARPVRIIMRAVKSVRRRAVSALISD